MKDKQSSIEWLRSLYENRPAYEECILDEEWEQAKAMHKEEIINATIYGDKFEGCYGLDSEQYYNETFGDNNEQQ